MLLFFLLLCFFYLRRVDSSLLKGAVAGVLRAHVSIFAPVTGEVPVHTGQAPAGGKKKSGGGTEVRRQEETGVDFIYIST